MIFALATLPMSLSLQSACSQDGPMFGIAAVVAALLARSRVTRQPKGGAVMIAGLALIAAARPAYLFLALLPLALPMRWPARIISALLVGSSTVAWIYLSWDAVGAELIEGVQGRYFLPLLLIVGGLGTNSIRPGGRAIWLAATLFPVLSLGITMRAVVLRYYLGS